MKKMLYNKYFGDEAYVIDNVSELVSVIWKLYRPFFVIGVIASILEIMK